ncbi:MAG: hypothetical protein ABSH00_03380 [Bryobacteraceae bacterium]|jgi:hypothetical protein
MENFLGCIVMAAVTLPLSFFVARGCLRAVIRVLDGSRNRDVL